MRRHVIERNRQIFELMQNGMGSSQICNAMGLPRSKVKNVLMLLRRDGEAALNCWSSERNERILNLADKGLHYTTIAERLDLSIGQVLGVLRRARLDDDEEAAREEREKRRRRYAPAEVRKRRNAEILKLLEQGIGQRAIARRLKVSHNTVIGFVDRQRRRGALPPQILTLLEAARAPKAGKWPRAHRPALVAVRPAAIAGCRISQLLAQADALIAG